MVSLLSGEGKSTVPKNFASLLAVEGAKTLLIDADTRNPSLTYGVGREREKGTLNGWIDLARVEKLSKEEMADAVYAYLVTNISIVDCDVLWTTYGWSSSRSRIGATYRSFIIIFMLLSFSVSGDGVFTIKTAALTWSLAGDA